MKRIAGTLMLLAGLGGCTSMPSLPGQADPSRNQLASARQTTGTDRTAARAAMPQTTPQGWPRLATPQSAHTVATPSRAPALPAVPAPVADKPEPKAANSEPPLPSPGWDRHTAARGIKSSRPGTPLLRLVNTRRITLDFEVKDVGPSGLSAVELWYTQGGKEWKKYDAPTNAHAYVVEVDEEGMYGFTLVARSGTGMGKEPPAPGDAPQVWVVVDLTKPDVQLTEVAPSAAGRRDQVNIQWKASDKNLGRQPVSLWYAEKEQGPWQVIAANLENTGRYVWSAPAKIPPRFLVRVEAVDLAGNVGRAQTPKPVVLDTSMPSVSIVNVEGTGTR